jgi:hypothetical protein
MIKFMLITGCTVTTVKGEDVQFAKVLEVKDCLLNVHYVMARVAVLLAGVPPDVLFVKVTELPPAQLVPEVDLRSIEVTRNF